MPYIAMNLSNAFDAANQIRWATQAEADASARSILAQSPTARVCVVQVLADYSAEVVVTAVDPATVDATATDTAPA